MCASHDVSCDLLCELLGVCVCACMCVCAYVCTCVCMCVCMWREGIHNYVEGVSTLRPHLPSHVVTWEATI